MRNVLCRRAAQAATCLLVMTLVGCASTEPSRYYLLSSLPGEAATKAAPSGPCVNLAIEPVTIPEYANRPQIVTRTTMNELAHAQFDRWAEPPSEMLSRVLAENLSRLLCVNQVFLAPRRSSLQPDFRVAVDIIRIDGEFEKEAVLEAWWTVSSGKEAKVLTSKQSRFVEPVKGRGYEVLVQAHSRGFAALSRIIAQEIGDLGGKGRQ